MTSLARKLQLGAGERVRLVNAPKGFTLDAPAGSARTTGAVVVFVRSKAELEERVAPAIEAALEDRVSWVAYPKAGQLGTDLSRDRLRKHLSARGVKPVRQVAIDDVWTALRFRPA
jgi:hypothetical protein